MKIAIFTKGGKYLTVNEMEQWSQLLSTYNITCYINYPDNSSHKQYGFKTYQNTSDLPADISFVVSYGGDGTLLHSIELFRENNIPILGINSGRLGFLASVPRTEIEKAIVALKNNEYTIEERPLMEITSNGLKSYAFNEFTLQKSSLSIINVSLSINGEYVANYMSDGLIISSPTGSTAYSMSVGGPIISPDCNCYIINPIAPHNLNMRPLIISDTAELMVSGVSREATILATIDNRSLNAENNRQFTIKKSSYVVKLVKLKETSFYRTIREKLMWGMDSRQINDN